MQCIFKQLNNQTVNSQAEMVPNKKINFSNIFSIRRSPRLISGLSQTTPTKSNKSKSPVLAEITLIPTYSNMKKLKLNQQTMDKIHYTQDIEDVSAKQYNVRAKNERLYMNYNQNPFTNIDDTSQKNQKLKGLKDTDKLALLRDISKKGINIIEGFTKLQDENHIYAIMKKLKKEDSNANAVHFSMIKNRQQEAFNRTKLDKQNIPTFQIKYQAAQTEQRSQLDQLRDIVAIKQTSYFTKKINREPINIFKISRYNDVRDKYCGSTVLRKFHFCFDAMMEKSQGKSLVDVYKDISDANRTLMVNNKSNTIPKEFKIGPQEITLSLDKIEFREIMFLCKGEIAPDALIKWMREDIPVKDKTKDGSQAADKQNQISYLPNQRNRADTYSFDNLDRTDIEYFQNLPYNRIQIQQNAISNKYCDQFRKIIKNQLYNIGNSINDKQLHQKQIAKKDRFLQMILQGNADRRNGLKFSQQVERKIRSNKLDKNRTEKIKTERLTETFIYKKISESKYRAKTNSRNKNDLATWR